MSAVSKNLMHSLDNFIIFRQVCNSSWCYFSVCFRCVCMAFYDSMTLTDIIRNPYGQRASQNWIVSDIWCISSHRPIIGRSRRRSCWSTTWWKHSETPAPSSMTTPAALANTWRWSSPTEGRWSEHRSPSTCWRSPESSTKQRKYHLLFVFVFFAHMQTPITAPTLIWHWHSGIF